MRVIASADAVEFVRLGGGRVYVWPVEMNAATGGAVVFSLEASTRSPGAEHAFVRFGGEDFDVLLDAGDHGMPDELHLAVKGWRRKRLRAYWNGNSFGRA
jgi:hypothetical protein